MKLLSKQENKELMLDRMSYYLDKFLESSENKEIKRFDYEEKFIAVMRMAEQEIFQLSLGTAPKSKNLKKNS
ncbi:MAG TPA: hypothetical protein VNE41_01360 [Chitinophagaceae bacterium]|nr:hypothetical protein [Chitinophagaceae bacterium]